MKLLIIAGLYEADRIRKAAAGASFEAVTIEPGQSLSVWITAIRPDALIVVPQAVDPDPALVLAKVRAIPRGQVPVFLVESPREARLRPLADGFLADRHPPGAARGRAPSGRPDAVPSRERRGGRPRFTTRWPTGSTRTSTTMRDASRPLVSCASNLDVAFH